MKYTNTNYVIAGPADREGDRTACRRRDHLAHHRAAGPVRHLLPRAGRHRACGQPFAHGYELVDGRPHRRHRFHASQPQAPPGQTDPQRTATPRRPPARSTPDRVVIRCLLGIRRRKPFRCPTKMGPARRLARVDEGVGCRAASWAWGHGGDIDAYDSFMAKTFDGSAISTTLHACGSTPSSPATDPRRGDVMSALYCPAA